MDLQALGIRAAKPVMTAAHVVQVRFQQPPAALAEQLSQFTTVERFLVFVPRPLLELLRFGRHIPDVPMP